MFFIKSPLINTGLSISTSFLKGALLLPLLSSGLGLQRVLAQPEHSQMTRQGDVAVSILSLTDGIYLYGQEPQPGQSETEYFVFELHNRQVVGAFYMPNSSFDCFRGNLTNTSQLQLTVMASYEEQIYDHRVSLNAYHSITQVSDNDLQIVKACQADESLMALEED
jgi:hypothetical protein